MMGCTFFSGVGRGRRDTPARLGTGTAGSGGSGYSRLVGYGKSSGQLCLVSYPAEQSYIPTAPDVAPSLSNRITRSASAALRPSIGPAFRGCAGFGSGGSVVIASAVSGGGAAGAGAGGGAGSVVILVLWNG